MSQEVPTLRVGQFSESPVLAVAKQLSLGEKHGINWTTERVSSSPGQFKSLADGEIDIAITSPDNVLLYATTDKNPIGQQLDLKFLRTIDRGLGLALYTSQEITEISQLEGSVLGVDVPNSGFAFLLFEMLSQLGVARETFELESVGATPNRLAAVVEGRVSATILNAETAVAAEQAGLKKWSSSIDVSSDYLGTVLVQLAESIDDSTKLFLGLWQEASEAIWSMSAEALAELLSGGYPKLASASYIALLKSEEYGLLRAPDVTQQQLLLLSEIRSHFGAYLPSDSSIAELLNR